jgi:hypothetical protein
MDMLQQDPHLAKAIDRRDDVLRRAQDTASWWKDEAHDLQAELGEVKKKYSELQEELNMAKAKLESHGSVNEGSRKRQRRMESPLSYYSGPSSTKMSPQVPTNNPEGYRPPGPEDNFSDYGDSSDGEPAKMQAPGKPKYLMVLGSPGNLYVAKADGVR